MRIRNTDDRPRDLVLSGGVVTCPPGVWVDLVEEAVAAGIPRHHAEIVALSVADAPGWELEQRKKPATGKEKN